MPRRNVVVLAGTFLAAVLAACDAAPGALDGTSTAPVVSDLQYTPETVLLSALPPGDVTDDSVRFAMSFGVQATGESLRDVIFAVRPPEANAPAIAVGTMTRGTGNHYQASITVNLARGSVGNYSLLVYALDDAGRLSNTLRGRISYVAEGGPPVITEVIAVPETINVQRDSVLVLIAVVDDPDGLANIHEVLVRTPAGQQWPMFDDGVTHDDPVAGDGRYQARFGGIQQATPNTTQVFRFQAFDRTGLASEVVEKEIRIE